MTLCRTFTWWNIWCYIEIFLLQSDFWICISKCLSSHIQPHLVLQAGWLSTWALESGSLVLPLSSTTHQTALGRPTTLTCFAFLICKRGTIRCLLFRVTIKMKMRQCPIKCYKQCLALHKYPENVKCYCDYCGYFLALCKLVSFSAPAFPPLQYKYNGMPVRVRLSGMSYIRQRQGGQL